VADVKASNQPAFGRMAERLGEAVAALKEATVWLGSALQKNQEAALAGATPYLRLFGLTAGGAYLARGALAAARDGHSPAAIAQARFFAENLLTAAGGLASTVTTGGDIVMETTAEKLGA
jgi:hypothetical protein